MSEHADAERETRTIRRLIGIYDADSTLRGELSYWVGARLGRAHCSLCDITHGLVRERADWKARKAELPVPFVTFHRNDQPAGIAAAAGNVAPIVVAETAAGSVRLLDPSELRACASSAVAMIAAIRRAVDEAGLVWPSSPP